MTCLFSKIPTQTRLQMSPRSPLPSLRVFLHREPGRGLPVLDFSDRAFLAGVLHPHLPLKFAPSFCFSICVSPSQKRPVGSQLSHLVVEHRTFLVRAFLAGTWPYRACLPESFSIIPSYHTFIYELGPLKWYAMARGVLARPSLITNLRWYLP